MSTPLHPDTIWSERFAEIGTVIGSDCELLIERWAERAKDEQPGAAHSHLAEMKDALPALLRAIGKALAQSGEEVALRHCLIALEHGEQRWRTGWQVTEVVRDYQILRLVILDHLDRTLTHWPLTIRETMAIGLALDEAISASVVSYVKHEEHELRQANERLGEFLAVLGHELRNPLSAIVTTLQLLRLQRGGLADDQQALDLLDRQVGQLTRLLDDMLDVSRIERGNLQLTREPIDVRKVVQQSIETTRSLLARRGHELRIALPDQPVELLADAGRLQQVITNLLTNAAKYTPPDGVIRVELATDSDQVVIRVCDNGEGIAAEMLPHIFQMFAQLPAHRGKGLGIGLSLARSLVEMHGGTLEAYSDGPGCGSAFECRLPMMKSITPVAPVPAELFARPTAPSRQFRILLIDDQVDALHELCLMLQLFGHTVHTAHNGLDGMEIARRVRPQVILIDLFMPRFDGHETARQLRSIVDCEQTLLVAMSGYPRDGDQQDIQSSAFDHFLMKPISFETVQKFLAEKQRAPAQPWN